MASSGWMNVVIGGQDRFLFRKIKPGAFQIFSIDVVVEDTGHGDNVAGLPTFIKLFKSKIAR